MKKELIAIDLNILNFLNKSLDFQKNKAFELEYEKNIKNFYAIDEESLKKIFFIIKDNFKNMRNVDQKFFKSLCFKFKFLNIDSLDFDFIKNEREYVIAILSVLILKAFAQKNFKIRSEYNLHEEIETRKFYSYSILNYINNQFDFFIKWISLKNSFNSPSAQKNYRRIIRTCIIFLQNEGVVKKININRKKNFTHEYWIPETVKILPLTTSYVFLSEFKYTSIDNNYYLYTNHFSSMTEVLTKNKHSGETFRFGDDRILNNLANSSFIVDINFLQIIFEKKLQEHNLTKDDLFDRYDILIAELKKMIQNQDLSILTEISQNISICEDLIRIYNLINNLKADTKIYLPFIFDFRGRLYYKSDVSPTFYTEMRYCMYNLNEKIFREKNDIFEKVVSTLQEYFFLIKNLNNFNFENFDDISKESIIWILINTAECEKTKLGKKVTIQQFIEHGIYLINNFNNLKKNWDINKELHVWYNFEVLNEIFAKSPKMRYFKKDSTASVFQIMIKKLGYKNEDFLKYCNLKSENTWYDTYEFILELFKTNCRLHYLTKTEFNGLFNRKNLKKSIMTENYLVKLDSFKNYFLKSIDLAKFDENKKNEILNLIELFFIFLRTNENLFKVNPKNISDYIIDQKFILIYTDDCQINFIYKKKKTIQEEIEINNVRHTKKFKIYSEELNKRKFNYSSRANYIHSLDAALMRAVLLWGYKNQISIFGLHDCWMVNYSNISALVAAVNLASNVTYHDYEFITVDETFYSFFIVL